MSLEEDYKPALLSVRSMSKSFGSVKALIDTDLDLYPGEVLALMGENGAGKSTLVKILAGLHSPSIVGSSPAAPVSPALAPPAAVAQTVAAPAAPAEVAPSPEEAVEPNEELHLVRSPIVGTFYAAPSPESPPFVKPGDRIEKGQVLCIVEAMKLMNEIEADVAGEVVEVYPKNAQPVEFDEPIFGVRVP